MFVCHVRLRILQSTLVKYAHAWAQNMRRQRKGEISASETNKGAARILSCVRCSEKDMFFGTFCCAQIIIRHVEGMDWQSLFEVFANYFPDDAKTGTYDDGTPYAHVWLNCREECHKALKVSYKSLCRANDSVLFCCAKLVSSAVSLSHITHVTSLCALWWIESTVPSNCMHTVLWIKAATLARSELFDAHMHWVKNIVLQSKWSARPVLPIFPQSVARLVLLLSW